MIEHIGDLLCDAAKLTQTELNINSLPTFLKIITDIHLLIQDAQGALPELRDLQAAEVGELSAQAYDVIKRFVAVVKEPKKIA